MPQTPTMASADSTDPVMRVGRWEELRGPATSVRMAVFVHEQGIDSHLEMDERDADCVHAVVFDVQGRPVATGRLLPDAHIGRMAVLREERGRGFGAMVLRALIEQARAQAMGEVRLHAQVSAIGFYERAGFTPVGEEYLEAGIVHRTMVRVL